MKTPISFRWAALITANALCWCMLSFQQPSSAAPAKEPFANAVEQRFEMLAQLKEINAQLKEQNALLRSGSLKVVVETSNKP